MPQAYPGGGYRKGAPGFQRPPPVAPYRPATPTPRAPANSNIPGSTARKFMVGGIARGAARLIPWVVVPLTLYEIWKLAEDLAGQIDEAGGWTVHPGWTKCPTPSCDGTVTHWFWIGLSSCAGFPACPAGQSAVGFPVAPGTPDATRRYLLMGEHTHDSAGQPRYTYHAAWLRDLASNVNYPEYVAPFTRPYFFPAEFPRTSPRQHPWLNPTVNPIGAPMPARAPSAPPYKALPHMPQLPWRQTGPRPAPRLASSPLPRPPGPGVKERKFAISKIGGLNLVRFIGAVTESADLGNALYDALPDRYKLPPHSLFRDKMLQLYKHFDKVNVLDAIDNIIHNEIEDRAFGAAGRAGGTAGHNLGLSYGFGTGPGFFVH